jgi:hypothetical protein
VSLVISRQDGAWFRCDGCSQPITERGLVLFRPLETEAAVETLIVHKACIGAMLVRTILPRYSSMPLTTVLGQLADTLEMVNEKK